MNIAYLSLGSNLGGRAENLRLGLRLLNEVEKTRVERASTFHRASPVGMENAREFLNAAARVNTALDAPALLAALKNIERAAGRADGGAKWTPRTLDIDIIFFGAERLNTPSLTVPHPRYAERLFVLLPLLEIEPELADPDGTPLARIVDEGKLENRFAGQMVEKIEDKA